MSNETGTSWSVGKEWFFQALADRTRLRILNMLAGGSEVCVGDLVQVIGTNQPKISRHLAYLRRRRLVSFRKEGLLVRYRLASLTDRQEEGMIDALLRAARESAEMRRDIEELERVRALGSGGTEAKVSTASDRTELEERGPSGVSSIQIELL